MIIAIIQARLNSTRLPKKVLLKIEGKTVLEHVVSRVKKSKLIDKVFVATTANKDDDKIFRLCVSKKIDVFRGSENDVLDRFYKLASKKNANQIVRITADCPMIDPKIIDLVIKKHLDSNSDYTSNIFPETFPDGEDVEIFKFSSLEKAWKNAKLLSEHEHVTPYIKKHTEMFKIESMINQKDYSEKRWTLDQKEDYKFIRIIFHNLYPENKFFGMNEILKFLEKHPEFEKINSNIARNEGYKKSLKEDKILINMNNKTQDLYNKAKRIIPGGTQLLTKRPEMHLPGHWPAYYKKAKGCEIWDLDEKKYIDMSYMGIGACVLGYSDHDINKAVERAIHRGSMSTLNCPEEYELAELLCQIHPWAEMVRYARCGGEAMAVSVRIARAATKKDIVLFCGYHGWHDWYLSANIGDTQALDGHLISGLNPLGVPRALKNTAFPFKYNNINSFLRLVNKYTDKIGAIIMEPIRNYYPEKQFIDTIQKKAEELKIPLVIDEVSSGWRINEGGAHLSLGIKPDIAVFAKAIGNGFPMAAIIGKSKYMKFAQDSFISSTNWTEKIGPTAAIATIKKYRKYQVSKYLMKIGQEVQDGWSILAKKNKIKIEVSGIYPMSHFVFKNDKKLIMKTIFTQIMLSKGFLATTAFYASYAHKKYHIKKYLASVDETFQIIKKIIESKNPEKYLDGQVCHTGFQRLN